MRAHSNRLVGVALALVIASTLACNAPGWGPADSDTTATPTDHVAGSPTSPPTATPTATATATATPAGEVTGPDNCVYDSLFVTDVTVPDDTEFAPGEAFSKVWQVRNSGTCTWESGIQLVYLSDDRMDGPGAVDVPSREPEATVDLRVDLVAPSSPGSHRSTWRLKTSDGRFFGDRVYVRIVVAATPTPSPTLTPTATLSPTASFTVTHPFDTVWEDLGGAEGNLGPAIADAMLDHNTVEQEFVGGTMYWREGFGPTPHHVFVLTRAGADVSKGTWTRHVDTWSDGDDELPCAEATLPFGPVRGFGLVWCENASVQLAMGSPLGLEEGSEAGFQKFSGGTLLWSSRLSYVYALFNDGTWRRFLVSP